jgi:hypothetical protein
VCPAFGAPLVAHDVICLRGERVDDLPFAFVAEICPYDRGHSHRITSANDSGRSRFPLPMNRFQKTYEM